MTATAAASQQRDAKTSAVVGTAHVFGDVVCDGTPPRPVRRAIVSLTGDGVDTRRSVITDDNGRFDLTGVPAGRYTLSVSRQAFLPVPYGATKVNEPGRSIVLSDGQSLGDLHLHMIKGAVIAGTVRDVSGTPAPDIQVVLWSQEANGAWTERPPLLRTDDLGTYRAFGLAPGTYVVMARFTATIVGGIENPESAGIDQALKELERGAQAEAPTTTKLWTFAPVMYPSGLTTAEAIPLILTAGEERTGIDLNMRLVTTATIYGSIAAPAGEPLPSVLLTADSGDILGAQTVTVRAEQDGRFRYPNVSPGRYVLTARSTASNGPAIVVGPLVSPRSGRCFWARADVSVAGSDVSGVTLALQPCLAIRGNVLFQADVMPKPSDLTSVRVRALPKSGNPTSTGFAPSLDLPPAVVAAGGQFEITGLLPGEYQLMASAPGEGPDGWWLKSILLRGHDVLDDGPFSLTDTAGEISDVAVVFSDRHTKLSGVVQGLSASAASNFVVVVFPADRALWHVQSRRVQASRLDNGNSFAFRDLPPGDYRLAAVSDPSFDASHQSEFLDSLVASAVSVTLGDGEHKTCDLRVAGRPF